MGTVEVEALSSYLFRLADAHGVSRFQLQRHMWESWGKHGARGRAYETVRINGYNKHARLAVKILNESTGRCDLAGCTLVSLASVCANNFMGSMVGFRHWCPQCLAEDIRSGRPVYDRLLWHIEVAERCPIHKIGLLRRCANCGGKQDVRSARASMIFICRACGAPLWKVMTKGVMHRPRPFLGEEKVTRLLEYISSNPEVTFPPDSVACFAKSLGQEFRVDEVRQVVGDVFHTRSGPTRPRLTSLVALAEYFDRDLVSILLEPTEAAKHVNLGLPPECLMRKASLRGKSPEVEAIRSALESVLESEGPFPSVAQFAKDHGITMNRLQLSLPLHVEFLMKKRAWYIASVRKGLSARLDSAQALMSVRLWKGINGTQRELAGALAAECDIPLHKARGIVADAIRRLPGGRWLAKPVRPRFAVKQVETLAVSAKEFMARNEPGRRKRAVVPIPQGARQQQAAELPQRIRAAEKARKQSV